MEISLAQLHEDHRQLQAQLADVKAFEAIAKTQKLDFVIADETLTAVIGK